MRIVVDLDDDVVAEIERLRRVSGMGLSDAVNTLARRGIGETPSIRALVQRTYNVGLRVDVDNVAEALELLEGPDAR